MEPGAIERELEDLETRIERLRALYEQYFLGIEKLEPQIPRKDVERKIQILRKEQIRNTALRFKFQMLIQRYNTMQQYWARVTREIENGTFRRDVIRAAARFGTKDALTILGKKRAKQYAMLAEAQAVKKGRPGGSDEEVELGDGDLIEEDDESEIDDGDLIEEAIDVEVAAPKPPAPAPPGGPRPGPPAPQIRAVQVTPQAKVTPSAKVAPPAQVTPSAKVAPPAQVTPPAKVAPPAQVTPSVSDAKRRVAELAAAARATVPLREATPAKVSPAESLGGLDLDLDETGPLK